MSPVSPTFHVESTVKQDWYRLDTATTTTLACQPTVTFI